MEQNKKEIEYDVLKVAIDQIRETEIKTIEVSNCQHTCPFILADNECGLIEIELAEMERLPNDKVHDKCPLKNNNYRIKLK